MSEGAARAVQGHCCAERDRAVDVYRGNHEGRARGRSILGETLETCERDGWHLMHGDKPPSAGTPAIIGHLHPSVHLGPNSAMPAFLGARDLVVVPALTPYSTGLDVLSESCIAALAPYVLPARICTSSPPRRTASIRSAHSHGCAVSWLGSRVIGAQPADDRPAAVGEMREVDAARNAPWANPRHSRFMDGRTRDESDIRCCDERHGCAQPRARERRKDSACASVNSAARHRLRRASSCSTGGGKSRESGHSSTPGASARRNRAPVVVDERRGIVDDARAVACREHAEQDIFARPVAHAGVRVAQKRIAPHEQIARRQAVDIALRFGDVAMARRCRDECRCERSPRWCAAAANRRAALRPGLLPPPPWDRRSGARRWRATPGRDRHRRR